MLISMNAIPCVTCSLVLKVALKHRLNRAKTLHSLDVVSLYIRGAQYVLIFMFTSVLELPWSDSAEQISVKNNIYASEASNLSAHCISNNNACNIVLSLWWNSWDLSSSSFHCSGNFCMPELINRHTFLAFALLENCRYSIGEVFLLAALWR